MAEDAETKYITLSKNDPFDTWLIADSSKAVNTLYKKLNRAVLSDSVITLKSLAKLIVAKTHPEYRIINTEEQFIIFSKIASKSGFAENGKRPSATLINQLIYIYNTKKTACIGIPQKSEKHKKIIEIIDAYEKWSEENKILDSFSVMEIAITAVKNGEFKIKNLISSNLRPSNNLSKLFLNTIIDSTDVFHPINTALPEGNPPTLKKENIVRYKDSKTEIKSVLEKICRLIESGTDPKKILVLTPSISKTVKLIDESIPDFYYQKDGKIKPLNYYCSEQGTPLANTPIVKSALTILSAVTHDYKLEDLEEILLSPFFTNSPVKITAGELHLMSIVSGVNSKKSEWQNISNKLSGKESGRFDSKLADVTILTEWLTLTEHKNTLAEHCIALKEWLKKSGWTDYPLNETDVSSRNKFLKLIDSMQMSVSSDEKTDLSVFYSYLLRFSLAKYVSETEKEDSFYAAKLSTASSIKADYVFIVGLSSDNIPNIPSTLPPFSEKETDEIVPDMKSDLYKTEEFHFRTALFSAEKELYLSCARKENSKNLVPSSFMTNLCDSEPLDEKVILNHSLFENQKNAGVKLIRNESCKELAGLTDSESVLSRVQREISNGYDTDFSADAAESFLKYDENTEFAPTTLERYADCPFKWYLNNHLKLYSAQEQGSEVTLIGTVVHKILERFIKEFNNSVTEENRDSAVEKIKSIARDEFEKIKIDSPEWIAKRNWYLGESGLPGVFEKFIDNELTYSKEGWNTPKDCVEINIKSVIKGENERTMKLKGKIDRILVKDNSFMIMDYKTGSAFKFSDSDKTHLQIPLYSQALSNSNKMKALGGFYQKVSTRDFKQFQVFKNDFDEKTKFIISKCFEIADAMKSGKCSVKSDKCEDGYCPYKYLCRHTEEEVSE